MRCRWKDLALLLSCTFVAAVCHAQPWSGIINSSRATNWANTGLPGDAQPDSSWTQCGSTIAAYGSSSSYASPSTIQTAINNCGANQFVLLGAGDFYLTGGVFLKSNMVLRGSGANQTRIHVNNPADCNGPSGLVCVVGSNTWGGICEPTIGGATYNMWSCPSGDYEVGYQNTANWTGSYNQGSSTIVLDNVTGIVPNLTPIVLDQCDGGFAGSPGVENCMGVDGAITSATVWSGGGGSGYAVGDTGKIIASCNWGRCYGGYNATYEVASVSSGAVTGFTITNGGSGYTYSSTNSYFGSGAPTVATSGSGTGFLVQITGITGYDNGSIFPCGITMICNIESDAGTMRPARSQEEVVVATAISGSGPYTVTISHPLMHPNWSSAQSPQAYWGTSTITSAGVENLMMDVSAVSASCVVMQTAYRVWATGVACSTANFFHILEYIVSNTLVGNSYFYWTKNAGTESYGVGSAGAVANSLYENNIVQGVVDPLNVDGSCAGCVFAYNFSVNDYDNAIDYLFASSPMHGGSTDYILEEGNIGAAMYQDMTHGPHFLDTLFRNYWTGYESNNGTMPLYSTIPVGVGAFSRYNNYLGNVLGTAGYHTVYECVPSSATEHYCSTDAGSYPGSVHIWDVGFSNLAQIDYDNAPATPNDLLTVSSLFRYGNYDVVHRTVQWNSAEVPASDPNFPNAVPASNSFPSSFYNGVTGAFPNCGSGLSFWKNPTTESCPPYPPIGPDVTNGDIGMCTGGTYEWSRALTSAQCAGGSFAASVNGGYGNSNPAMRCYLNQMAGPPDGTGSMLAFDPASCYAADSAASPAATPTFSPTAGTYTAAQSVTISDTTPNATIYYTTNGTTPTENSAVYTAPVAVAASETIEAIATASGYATSDVASAAYTINLPAPTFSLAGAAVTLAPGAATGNTSTITVTPSNGFTGSVALTAAIASSPAGAVDPPTLSFGATSPVSIAGAKAATATLTISTTAPATGALERLRLPGSRWLPQSGAALACLVILGISTRRKRWQTLLGMLVLLVVLAGGVLACGGSIKSGGQTNPGTTPGAYTITVTGTSGSLQQTTTISLTVN